MNEQVEEPPIPSALETVGAPIAQLDQPPWSPWASLGWTAFIVMIMFVVQIIVYIVFLIPAIEGNGKNLPALITRLTTNGLFVSVSVCCTAFVCTFATWLLTRLRTPHVRHYLALQPVKGSVVALCLVVIILFNIASDGVSLLFHHHIVDGFTRQVYSTAGIYPLLWFALGVAAPVFEETLFRGFLFRGLMGARTGVPGAILCTAFIWACMHIQYDLYGIATVFVMGLLFGFVRARTGSIYSTLAMHVVTNLTATLEAALQHQFGYN